MKQAIILILLILFFSISAIAEDRIRCSGKVIASGSTKFELERNCGSPASITTIGEEVLREAAGSRETTTITEEWYYRSLAYGKDVVFTVSGSTVIGVKRLR